MRQRRPFIGELLKPSASAKTGACDGNERQAATLELVARSQLQAGRLFQQWRVLSAPPNKNSSAVEFSEDEVDRFEAY